MNTRLRPARRRASSPPLPGSPLGYYRDVVRSRWFYLIWGAVLGGLLAALVLVLWPSQVTATTTVHLSSGPTDPTRVTGPPSSRIDRGTEEELGRSVVVAERAAADLDGRFTTPEVVAATVLVVGSESAIATVQFRGDDAEVAAAGADAVAKSYLALRLDLIRAQGEEHAERIQARIDAIQDDLASGGEPSTSAGDTAGSRALTEELTALVQQRAALVSQVPDGGRVISPAAAQVESGRPWLPGLVTGMLVGLLVGLAAAFARHRGPRQVSGPAEVADLSGRPVWSAATNVAAEHRWRVASRLMLTTAPGCESVLVATLANAEDTAELVGALREAGVGGVGGGRALSGVTSAKLADAGDLAANIDSLSAVEAVVLLVDPRSTSRAALVGAIQTVDELGVPLIGSFWCTPRGGAGPRTKGSS